MGKKTSLSEKAYGSGRQLIDHGATYDVVCWVIAIIVAIAGLIIGIAIHGSLIFVGIVCGLMIIGWGKFMRMIFTAFGEIVINTEVVARAALGEYDRQPVNVSTTVEKAPQKAETKPVNSVPKQKISSKIHRCQGCGAMVNCSPCPKCGYTG